MIKAEILLDSCSKNGARLTTFILTYPRFIHCFDDKTEVLCEIDGMKKFILWKDAVILKPKLANYHKSGKINFAQPKEWIVNDVVNEEMIEIKSQRISMLVTKGHRLFVGSRKKDHDEWEIIKAEEMLNHPTQKRFTTFGYIDEGKNIGKLANLIGFFIGDGTLPKHGHQAIFHLKKDRKIQYIKNILKDLNIEFKERSYKDGTTNIIVLNRLDVFKECYDVDGQKKIPKIIHNVDDESFYGFLDGLWNADGSTDKGYLKIFNTSSEYVANILCTLSTLHGVRINFKSSYGKKNKNHYKMYKLTNSTETQPIIRADKHPAKIINYTGKVYCAAVDTGLLIVRREGLVHVSGNCEIMTHRVFSRNAASSRAIPVKKMIEDIRKEPAMPVYFGKNQSGMQAKEELSPEEIEKVKNVWIVACENAIKSAEELMNLGLHKQIANRILEPWFHMRTLVTATEWDNFYALRRHPDAQPEFKALADAMWEAKSKSVPQLKFDGEWHLPFVKTEEWDMSLETVKKISVARCCRISYLNLDGSNSNVEKDIALHDSLLQSGHLSPMEHAAMCTNDDAFYGNFRTWKQYRKEIMNEENFAKLSVK